MGRPIVMIHGFGVDHRLLLDAMEPLFAERPGWQRLYFDLPGMGKTPAVASLASSDDLLDVVTSLIESLVPTGRFTLVGQSYGGYLARGLVSRQAARIDGVALLCPAIVADGAARELPPKTVLVESRSLVAGLTPADAKDFEAFFVVQSEANWRRFRDFVLPGIRCADEQFLERIARRYQLSFPVDPLPAPFPSPMLLVTGRQDAVVGYRDAWRILESYPRGTFAVLDRAGHNLHIEQSALTTALVGEWIDRVQDQG